MSKRNENRKPTIKRACRCVSSFIEDATAEDNRSLFDIRMTDPDFIHNWRRLDERVTTSGQPTEAQLAEIRALGVRHIVNLGLHTHEKALPDEAASVAAYGMNYIHIPVDFQNPTEDDFSRFCLALEATKDDPTHVHCIANYRVSAFFYRYRRDLLGWDEVKARDDLESLWKPPPNGIWAAFISRRTITPM